MFDEGAAVSAESFPQLRISQQADYAVRKAVKIRARAEITGLAFPDDF